METIFKTVQAGRASEEIALQIEAAIMEGNIQPGQSLPSERELQVQFGTGRGVVREALQALKQKGLLEIRKGAKGGAYVRNLEVANVSESLSIFLRQKNIAAEHLVEFREGLDHNITILAIARASAQEKQSLFYKAHQLVDLLAKEDVCMQQVGELDKELNIMLAAMSNNPIYEWIMRAIQMGLSSYDYALYNDLEMRTLIGKNWVNTAMAIKKNEPLQAKSFISNHYRLLLQCIKNNKINGGSDEK